MYICITSLLFLLILGTVLCHILYLGNLESLDQPRSHFLEMPGEPFST